MDALNSDEDRNVARDQDLRLLIDRSLKGPAFEAAIASLPAKSDRASKALWFDANGDPTAIAGTLSSVGVSSFMATVLDDTTAAAACATLGVTRVADRPYFRANKNAVSQTGIADVTATKVTFTNEVVDNGAYYDAPNSKWTPPAGPVLLIGRGTITGTFVAGNELYLVLRKNGTSFAHSATTHTAGAGGEAVTVTAFDVANGTDYYEIFAFADLSAGTANVSGSVSLTGFEGVWLG